MRKDRYVTNDKVADIDRLTELEWSVDQKNTASIRWSWPRNGGVKLAAVFTAETAEDTLESLLAHQSPVIITKDMDKSYNKPLDAAWRIYRVFPAHFGEGSDVVILNQKTDNTTGKLTRIVTVNYKIEYKPLPLSEYRRVNLIVRCSDTLPSERALAYAKYRNSTRVCEYPLGHAGGSYVCYVRKNEVISLYASDEYSNVVLTEEKS